MTNLPRASSTCVPGGTFWSPLPLQTLLIVLSTIRMRALAIGALPVPSIKVPPWIKRLEALATGTPRVNKYTPSRGAQNRAANEVMELIWVFTRIFILGSQHSVHPATVHFGDAELRI